MNPPECAERSQTQQIRHSLPDRFDSRQTAEIEIRMCPQGSGGELTGKRQKECSRTNEMFYILFWEVVTQMDATVKIHQNQHPRSVHFYVRLESLKEV